MALMSTWRSLLLYLLLICWGAKALAIQEQDIVGKPENTFTSIDAGQVEGERIDVRTLTLSWEVKDLVIPGSGGLELVISRSFGKAVANRRMQNWELEVPRIQVQVAPPYGTTAGPICSNPAPPSLVWLYDQPSPPAPMQPTSGSLFRGPLLLLLPGERPKQLLVKVSSATQFPADAKYVTVDNWIVKCINAGNAFEVTSPRGTRYVMDKQTSWQKGEPWYGTYPGYQVYSASTCVFRLMPASDSAASRPPIPRHAGRVFRGMPATPTGRSDTRV